MKNAYLNFLDHVLDYTRKCMGYPLLLPDDTASLIKAYFFSSCNPFNLLSGLFEGVRHKKKRNFSGLKDCLILFL